MLLLLDLVRLCRLRRARSGKSSFVLTCLKGRKTETIGSASTVYPPITLTSDVLTYSTSLTLIDTPGLDLGLKQQIRVRRKVDVYLLLLSKNRYDLTEIKHYLTLFKGEHPNAKYVISLPQRAMDSPSSESVLDLSPDIVSVHIGQESFQVILDSIQTGVLYPKAPIYDRGARALTLECCQAFQRVFALHQWYNHLDELSKLLEAECPLASLEDLYDHLLRLSERGSLEIVWTTLWDFGYQLSGDGRLELVYPKGSSSSNHRCQLSMSALKFLGRLQDGISKYLPDGQDGTSPFRQLVNAIGPLCVERDSQRVKLILERLESIHRPEWPLLWSIYTRCYPRSVARTLYRLGYCYIAQDGIEGALERAARPDGPLLFNLILGQPSDLGGIEVQDSLDIFLIGADRSRLVVLCTEMKMQADEKDDQGAMDNENAVGEDMLPDAEIVFGGLNANQSPSDSGERSRFWFLYSKENPSPSYAPSQKSFTLPVSGTKEKDFREMVEVVAREISPSTSAIYLSIIGAQKISLTMVALPMMLVLGSAMFIRSTISR